MLSRINLLRGSLPLIAVLYGVELLDELIYGLDSAALPHLRNEFALTYTQVGLLFTLPGLLALLLDPVVGLLGDTRHRRLLVVGGITATLCGLVLIGVAQSYGALLFAFCVMYLASGAYVDASTLRTHHPQRNDTYTQGRGLSARVLQTG